MLKLKNIFGSTGSIQSHSIFYLIGNIFSKGFLLISMPFLTRMLNPSDFGVITVFESIYGVMSILFSFAVADSISRYYYEEKEDFNTAAGSMYILASILSALLLFTVLVYRNFLSEFFSVPAVVIFYAGILAFSDLPKTIYLQLLNAKEKSKKYSIYASVASFLSLSFTLLLSLIHI